MREIHACFGRLTTDFACDNWNGNGVLEEHFGARFESITILSVIKKKRLKRKYFSLIFSDSCLRFYGGLRPPSRNRVEVDDSRSKILANHLFYNRFHPYPHKCAMDFYPVFHKCAILFCPLFSKCAIAFEAVFNKCAGAG